MLPFSDTDIDSVVALAFEHTAGAVPHPSAEIPTAREWVSAALFISGPWECVVTLAVDSALASTLTSAMWDTAEVSRADVDDAVGELLRDALALGLAERVIEQDGELLGVGRQRLGRGRGTGGQQDGSAIGADDGGAAVA